MTTYAVVGYGVVIMFGPAMLVVALLWWPMPGDKIAPETEPVVDAAPAPAPLSGGYQMWCRVEASPVEADTEPLAVIGYHPVLSARPSARSFVLAGRS